MCPSTNCPKTIAILVDKSATILNVAVSPSNVDVVNRNVYSAVVSSLCCNCNMHLKIEKLSCSLLLEFLSQLVESVMSE